MVSGTTQDNPPLELSRVGIGQPMQLPSSQVTLGELTFPYVAVKFKQPF